MKRIAVYVSLCIVWGSTWAVISVLVSQVAPLRSAAVRFVLAGLLLLPIALIRRVRWPLRSEWRAIALMSVLMFGVPYALIFWAEQHISSSLTAVLYAAMPLFMALLTPLMNGRRVPRAAMQAILLGWGGLLVVLSGALTASHAQTGAAIAVLISVVCQAFAALAAKRQLSEISPLMSNSLSMLGGGLVLSLGSAVLERHTASHWTHDAIGALWFLIIVASCYGFTTYFWLLQKMEPYKVATMQLIIPLVAIAEGALWLRERVPLPMLFGSAIVLASVGFVLRAGSHADEPISVLVEEVPAP
ncbi:MAG TPA: EamA family transporter [Acidobacteriaceae bacterium]|nr:EamA family transporter [Acidobacteriaceae bacterium]